MDRNSLNRPPRPKRPAEVIRHVDETMDAYRRMVDATRKEDKAVATERTGGEGGGR
jgi:hypothetical protein